MKEYTLPLQTKNAGQIVNKNCRLNPMQQVNNAIIAKL